MEKKKSSKRKVLITGGAGFIGSHLARFHLDQEDEVWIVDNLSTGRQHNLPDNHGKLQIAIADVCQWDLLSQAVAWADRIYHMAAMVGQKNVLLNPITTLSINIHSLEAILKAMLQVDSTATLLVPSSSSVYSLENATFQEDDVIAFYPNDYFSVPYRLSKLVNEVTTLAYVRQHNLDCRIVRLFNTVGPGQLSVYGMVLPTFIKQALINAPLTIYGDGTQTRCFCHVNDAIFAIDRIMEQQKCQGKIINIGQTEVISILDLAKKVKEMTHSSSPFHFLSYQEAYGFNYQDMKKREPNLEKLYEMTGFKPKTTLSEIIQEMIAYYKQSGALDKPT